MSRLEHRDTEGEPSSMTRTAVIARAIAFVVFVALAVVVGLLIPIDALERWRDSLLDLGAGGAALFVLLYAGITLTPAPKNVLSIAAGLAFGFWWAVGLVYAGALLGAALAFLIGRLLGRDAVERFTGSRVARLDDLLRRRGLAAVVGVRLIPIIPFTAINYGAGLTAVRRRDYALGTAVGIIPGTAAYVALGAFGFDLEWPAWVAIGVLGALTIAGAIWAGRRRRTLSRTGTAETGTAETGTAETGTAETGTPDIALAQSGVAEPAAREESV